MSIGLLSNLDQEGSGVEEGQQGRKMGLEQIKHSLPDLDGQNRRVQCIKGILGGIFGGRRDGFPRTLSLGTIPISIAVLPVDQRGNISFAGARADANGRGGIDTVSTGGFAGATGGIDAGVDAFNLASTASGAGYTGAHDVR